MSAHNVVTADSQATAEQQTEERDWYETHPGGERRPLLQGQRNGVNTEQSHSQQTEQILDTVVKWSGTKTRPEFYGLLTFIFIIIVVLFWAFYGDDLGRLPRNPHAAALKILSQRPVIDGHIDLPELMRTRFRNNVTAVDLRQRMPGHVDIPRLRKGKVGAFFWSVYVSCPAYSGYDEGVNFTNPTFRVRDTLEQIDVAKLLIDEYPDTFKLALGTADVRTAIESGKIASLLGVEGAHQLGNSLGVLRTYYQLGVRYVTLTHACNNAFADSCGIYDVPEPVHGGLSPIGRTLVAELNRLGMIVDLSHTSDATAIQAFSLSHAPVIWSHSSARAVHNVPRNVPDEILSLIGTGEGKKDAVVMVNFAPMFVAAPGNATVQAVADHVQHIADIAGKLHVGIGSDYDGISDTPVGLEDASTYPNLFAELLKRGWTRDELEGLAGGNLLRVFRGVEKVARDLQGYPPAMDIYEYREDL